MNIYSLRVRAALLSTGLILSPVPGARAYTLSETLRSIRARPEDLKLRPELAPDPYRLRIVDRLMGDPAGALKLSSSVGEGLLDSRTPAAALDILTGLLDAPTAEAKVPAFPPMELPLDPELSGPVSRLIGAIAVAQKEVDAALSGIPPAQRKELLDFLRVQLTDSDPDPDRLRAGETWLERDEKLLGLAASVPVDRILRAGRGLLVEVAEVLPQLRRLDGARLVPRKTVFSTEAGLVVLGSPRAEVFDEDAVLIVDFGGDDVYRGAETVARPGKVRVIIDLGGDDHYLSSGFGGLAGGLLGISIVVDAAGSDTYVAEDAALGAGLFGLGVLWDLEGDDLYRGRSFTEGAGAFGVGMLIDASGRDVYRASYLSQGAGYTRGAGLLLDVSGNDLYSAGFSQPDPRGYIESYGKFRQGEVFQSLSQGFATGWRDMAAGGVGLLIDGAGNDVYQADYFAQGAAYWLSWGMLYDRSGNDVYSARRYAQGAGVHFAVGTLLDASGNDRYSSWAVSQGCGHDYSLGLLWDGDGDDAYIADFTAIGSQQSMGVGILRDEGGSDRYIINKPAESFWDPRRSASGIGFLLDSGGGADYFSVRTATRAWNSTRWGAGLAQAAGSDWGLTLPPREAETGDSIYERFAAKDGAFAAERLAHSRTLGERTRLSELLSVASGWGMNGSVPEEAKRSLLSEEPGKALPLLMGWLNPKNIFSRMNLEEYFFTAPEARRLLEAAASGAGDPLLRARAVFFLGELRSPESLPVLLGALKDAHWRVRVAASRALGFAQSEKFRVRLEKLARLLGKPSPGEVSDWFASGEKNEAYAVLTLARLERSEWAEMAPGLVQDNTAPAAARKAAAVVLAQARTVKAALEDRIRAMGRRLGGEELARALKDADPEVRHWAAYALGLMREEPDALASALEDPDYAVREAAADSLSQLGAAALPALKGALRSSSGELRALAYKALGGMEDKSVRRLLIGGLDDKDAFARLSALQSLEEGRDRGLWELDGSRLLRLVRDANPWVRDRAQALLEPR